MREKGKDRRRRKRRGRKRGRIGKLRNGLKRWRAKLRISFKGEVRYRVPSSTSGSLSLSTLSNLPNLATDPELDDPISERSDDGVDSEEEDDEDEEMEMPTMTSEERASRLETLVAPLPVSEWGQQATDSSSAAPPPLSEAPNATPSTKEPRPAKFEAEKYDGASSDSDSSDEAMPGEEGLGTLNEVEEGEDDEEEPAVMNEEDMLDMGEEMDEFLKFATETLGLSEAQYQGILGERRQRGGELNYSPVALDLH